MAHAPETIWLIAEDDLTVEWHLTIESAKTWGTPVEYTRADLFRAQLQQMEDNAVDFEEACELRIALLTALLNRARDRLDAFADADLIEETNSGAWRAIGSCDGP